MSAESSVAPLKRLLRFPFRDPRWQGKFVVGSALALAGSVIPIVPTLFVYGYFVRIMRQVLAGQAPTLPQWDDWGDLFRDGLRAFAIGLVYFLPAMVVWLAGMGLYFAGSFYLPAVFVTETQPGQPFYGFSPEVKVTAANPHGLYIQQRVV